MLKIEKMEISGFKSFSDKTEIRLPDGITAVVGPNGCGKSNIGDAINWVLGEQSPKMLRGKHMADVIFNGSRGRKPLGMAEVSLHWGGAEGLPFEDQGKIAVTRRLFRSGESDYLINGKRARLKDIQEFLNQARVGARSYATIEQGKIDQILNSKPRDRRQIIEDAAGIAGYKQKRRLTELKLEATHANLLRVNDIVQEVERQIRSLKRQAAKARRYRRLREELRADERLHFGLRARTMERELDQLRKAEAEVRDAEAEAAARLGRREVQLVDERAAVGKANDGFREASERLHQLELEIGRSEAQIRGCAEKLAEAEESFQRHEAESAALTARVEEQLAQGRAQRSRIEQARAELARLGQSLEAGQTAFDSAEEGQRTTAAEVESLRREQFEAMNLTVELRNRLRNDEGALERVRTQRARLEAERSTADQDWSRLKEESTSLVENQRMHHEQVEAVRRACLDGEERLRLARERNANEIESLAEAREREKSAVAKQATLEDIDTRFAGVSDGVRTLLSQGRSAGLRTHGVVADFIEAGTDVESAAEGYLNTFLPTVILEDDADVQRASEMLRSSGAGRTSLISRNHPSGALAVGTRNGGAELPSQLAGDPRVRGRLSDRLTLRTSANGVIRDRVGDAVLVENLPAALELHRLYPSADYLTVDGDVVYASGVVTVGGRRAGDEGLLAHKRRLHEAESQATHAAGECVRLKDRAEQSRQTVERYETALGDERRTLEQATQRAMELELQVRRSTEEGDRTGRHAEVLQHELDAIDEERLRHEQSVAELTVEVQGAEERDRTLAGRLRARTDVVEGSRDELKRLTEQLVELRADAAARQERQDALDSEGTRLEEVSRELNARLERSRAEAGANRSRAASVSELRTRTESDLAGFLNERKQLAEEVARLEAEIEGRQRRLEQEDAELGRERERLEALRERTREAELARTRSDADRAHLDDLCRQELGCAAGEAAEAIEEAHEDTDPGELEQRIADTREKLEKIGPVNMTAIEEFSELEERHAFLTAQREDLDRSMTSLRETTRRLNRTSREKFIQAFEEIRSYFQEIFKLLFSGGRADLQLEEGEDVLECGIEIMVQPPGKRLGTIQLMSGGEKALSAIALLFAVFRYRPSPFCLLDEVDAALDDANVGRFGRMVTEYAQSTQFILVTHNKLSMETAGLLYGVTMEEPGVSKVVSLELE